MSDVKIDKDAKTPDEAHALYQRGRAHLAEGAFAQAIECFDKALALAPANREDIIADKHTAVFRLVMRENDDALKRLA